MTRGGRIRITFTPHMLDGRHLVLIGYAYVWLTHASFRALLKLAIARRAKLTGVCCQRTISPDGDAPRVIYRIRQEAEACSFIAPFIQHCRTPRGYKLLVYPCDIRFNKGLADVVDEDLRKWL